MTQRKIKRQVRGHQAVDGAGVHLVRVLGLDTVEDFDPFLMLDSFDSTNPADYTAGFPMHPHRGIETVTYLIQGEIDHEDSLGNAGKIRDGQSQWMTAGSGILHQEMPRPSARILGVQLWLNLPQDEKMTEPKYFDIAGDMIGEKVTEEGAVVRVLAGEYEGVRGAKPHHIQATYYDIALPESGAITLPAKPDETVFVFLIEGDALIENNVIPEKTAVLFGEGEALTVAAPPGQKSRFLFLSAKPLGQPVAWGGPVVMNTRAELLQAFKDLEEGNFIRHKPVPSKAAELPE